MPVRGPQSKLIFAAGHSHLWAQCLTQQAPAAAEPAKVFCNVTYSLPYAQAPDERADLRIWWRVGAASMSPAWPPFAFLPKIPIILWTTSLMDAADVEALVGRVDRLILRNVSGWNSTRRSRFRGSF